MARSGLKWMSATIGSAVRALISGIAFAAASFGMAIRMSWQAVSSIVLISLIRASTSSVFAVAIVWMTIG